MVNNTFRSGFVSIIGRPNVGKSTLLNYIVKSKIAIMSNKPQTTRNKIQGIYNGKNIQIVFIDTPGIHKPHSLLGDMMVKSALSTLKEVDGILFMVSAIQKRSSGDNFIIDHLKNIHKPIYLVINKIDKVHPNKLIDIVNDYKNSLPYKGIYPISALNGNNILELLSGLSSVLPVGPKYYPDGIIVDHPEKFIISELIREKIFQLTSDEIPHSTAVIINNLVRKKDEKILIQATIVVERDSQKGIVIGKNGKMLKAIGIRSRKDIELLLGDKVYLELWVKVKSKWRNKELYLNDLGYRDN